MRLLRPNRRPDSTACGPRFFALVNVEVQFDFMNPTCKRAVCRLRAEMVALDEKWADTFYRVGSLFHTADRVCAGGLCVLLLAAAAPAQLGTIAVLLVGLVAGMVWHLGFRCCGFWAGMVAIGSPLAEPTHWPLVTLGYALTSVLVAWIPTPDLHRRNLTEIAL